MLGVEGGNDSFYNTPGHTGIAKDFRENGRHAMILANRIQDGYSGSIDATGSERENCSIQRIPRLRLPLWSSNTPWMCQNDELEVARETI